MRRTAATADVISSIDALIDLELEYGRRAATALGIGINDVKVLQYLLSIEPTDEAPTPRSVAQLLGVSSASVTALIDRLEAAGWVARQPHPHDRRSITIRATIAPDSPARRVLATRGLAITTAVAELSSADRRVIVDFVDSLRYAHRHLLDDADTARV